MVWKLNTVLAANMDLVENLWFLPLSDSVAEAWCTSVYWECSSYWQILHNQGKTDLLSFARALSSLVLILVKNLRSSKQALSSPRSFADLCKQFQIPCMAVFCADITSTRSAGAQIGHADEKWMASSAVVKQRCLDTDAAGHSRASSWLGHKSSSSFWDSEGGLAAPLDRFFLRRWISLQVDKEEGLS